MARRVIDTKRSTVYATSSNASCWTIFILMVACAIIGSLLNAG